MGKDNYHLVSFPKNLRILEMNASHSQLLTRGSGKNYNRNLPKCQSF